MVQSYLIYYSKCKVLVWDNSVVPMKEPGIFLGKLDLTKCKIQEVVMQTSQPASTEEYNEWFKKLIDSNYAKDYLEKLAKNGQ